MGFLCGGGGKESTCQFRRHEMWVWSLSWEDSLKEDIATHSSILAWKIPWREEPGGGYSSWGCKASNMTEVSTHTRRANAYGQLSVNQTYDSSILWSPTHYRIYIFGVGNFSCIIFHFLSSTKTVVGRKVMTNLDSIFKSRDITLPTKVRLSRLWFFQWSCMDVRVGLWKRLSAEELMCLNSGVGENSWGSLGLQGDPTSPFWRRSALGFLRREWC